MNAARLLYPVKVLGPGQRIGLWMCGCPHRCEGCSNPELWAMQPKYEIAVSRLIDLIGSLCAAHPVDGFTITGGDPFYQPEALCELLSGLTAFSKDILVYTGWQYETLLTAGRADVDDALKRIAVLIDGPYIASRNNDCVLRGSDNQRILFLKPEFEPVYQTYLHAGPNRIQNFTLGNSIVSVGIHRPDYGSRMARLSLSNGLEESSHGQSNSEMVPGTGNI